MDPESLIRHVLVWLLLAALPLIAVSGLRRPPALVDVVSPPAAIPDATATDSQQSRDRSQREVTSAAQPVRFPVAPLADEPWFLEVQEQLRRLGANYVRLEKWHSQPAIYYFECHVAPPLPGATPATTQLSSLSASPHAATLDVLRRVQQMSRGQRVERAEKPDRALNSR